MSAKGIVYLIDDEKHIRLAGKQTLELAGYEVDCFESAGDALQLISTDWAGVVVSDIKMPKMDGLTFLARAVEVDPDLPVILVTGHGDISMAVSAMREGAYDFIEKPFSAELLVDVVKRATDKRQLTLENRSLRRELEAQSAPGPRIIGKAAEIQKLRSIIGHIGGTNADVLIVGDTGSGKELVARSLHEISPRHSSNFVAINCGAVPESIIESELFGHESGAFTGATQRRIGKFEHANGGTLFLDEIESMPLFLQVKLLRVLQERCVERLGSNESIPLDLRIIAASKVDLKEASAEGNFREDLYYRLNVVTIEIPQVKDRLEDIPLLFQHFALVASSRYQKEVPPLTAEQMHQLIAHDWPGNVREIRNMAERYVLLGDIGVFGDKGALGSGNRETGASLPEQVELFERSLIDQALTQNQGNISKTYEELGLPRKTLYDKMKKYGLERNRYK